MSDLRELYQEVILDHSRHPRNYKKVQAPSCHADGHNPLCGDQISVDVKMQDGRLTEVGFQGDGCAICKASASLMTETVQGKSEAEVDALFEKFHTMVTEGLPQEESAKLGKLAALSGVKEYPVRVKCASLAWHTLRSALKKPGDRVTTE